ncbi:MAG: anacyclamide/piricyclamide family prenylated cyclic peptide [Microcystis novacekii Mn_MB_F_20050700_S1]|uniref:Anacyclamide/piricyclamide family prenylated cyclic peptide n=1 Tax=Microcystis novacekii Mn_MB_F_20050700_S1D TaxID=2486266 RepID=A0A552IKY5_9CHRO|nr:MAG: anacyclamide/piricyclamide family prenylated cyclic peptide [Microcystis novacekii Mn_MB_F_20050700_S1D]TRU90428.1 MAG: anacyclamide/piricyclamide family prenylated cyclic peptide [Microcystis novacekii Mn_MB_F_20050700_S1]
MTKKNLKPQQAAPVQRENTATVSRDGNASAQLGWGTFCVGEDGEGNWMEVRTAVCGRRRRVVPPVRASDFKSCQKSFSACQGARFASMN